MPRLPLAPYDRRPRRQLFAPMAAGMAARRIQAAARGFLARRQAARMRRPRLMSPMDISKIKRRKTQGQIPKRAVRGVMPKYRIGTLVGTEKSKRPVSLRKLDPMEIKTHIDSTSAVSQTGVAYFGFPDAGSQDEQLRQGCYALVNMFTRRAGLKMASINADFHDTLSMPTDVYTGTRLSRICIGYTRHDADGNGVYAFESFTVTRTDSIKALGDVIFNDIKAKAYNPASAETDGLWPAIAHLQTQDIDTQNNVPMPERFDTFASYDLTNVMTDFSFMRKYKWQNVTPAGTDRNNINDIAANPLSGKIYKFKGPTPLVRAKITDQLTTVLRDSIEAQGVSSPGTDSYDYLRTEAFRDNSFSNVLDVPFKQPFKANQFFKNALTEDKCYLPPGGYKQLVRKDKVTMNFRRFCQATVYRTGSALASFGYVQNMPAKIGTCTLWGLEPAVRTVPNEVVQLHVNMETWYTTKCRIGQKKQPVVTDVKVVTGQAFS